MKNWFRQFTLDLHLPKPPFVLIAAILIFVPLTWLPLVFAWRTNVTLSEKRPIHLFLDMDVQPRFDAQQTNPIFADNRSMRPSPPGTVAFDAPLHDDHFALGYHTDSRGNAVTRPDPNDANVQLTKYHRGFPAQIQIDRKLLDRGRLQFNIYCYPCHGKGGYGDGPVTARALGLMEFGQATWTQPSDLHALDPESGELTYGDKLYPEGKLFNTITNGIRNMPGYGSQIEPGDRWAIIAYVRALQLSQRADVEDVPAPLRSNLKEPVVIEPEAEQP